MDSLFRVETISATPNPQTVVYAAARQDYSHDFIYDRMEELPDEDECGEWIIKHLLAGGRGHYGCYEHPQLVVNFGYFPHSAMVQLRTHRNLSFDVQCLAGDTNITLVNKHGDAYTSKTIEDLYDIWENGEKAVRTRNIRGRKGEAPGTYRRNGKTRLKKLRLRSLHEENNTFTINNLENVVYNGINPVYQVTLEDGKTIKCTQNHQFYTPYGWRRLEQLGIGSSVMANGTPLANADTTYQSKEWLSTHFAQGLRPKDMAAIAGCSTESIKKWAYKHELTWNTEPWNTGVKGYKINVSEEGREKHRQRAINVFGSRVRPKGEDHPCWKKDLPFEKRVYQWTKSIRNRILTDRSASCVKCGSNQRLSLHHIQTVKDRPDLAFDEGNIKVLCSPCHSSHHHADDSINPLCSHPVKIISIQYVGLEPTYDLCMKAPHHNFVANGIVVHNSGRYTSAQILAVADEAEDVERVFYLRPVGTYTNRQGKKYTYTEEMRREDIYECVRSAKAYAYKVETLGMSEEHARGTGMYDIRQHFVMSGNARAIMHLLDLRAKKDAQLECQQAMELLFKQFKAWMPEVAEWYSSKRLGKGNLAP
jgi:thymidylate synthase (FAD)